jgi:hypothetical protein
MRRPADENDAHPYDKDKMDGDGMGSQVGTACFPVHPLIHHISQLPPRQAAQLSTPPMPPRESQARRFRRAPSERGMYHMPPDSKPRRTAWRCPLALPAMLLRGFQVPGQFSWIQVPILISTLSMPNPYPITVRQ